MEEKDLTEEQKEYIKNNYPNMQTAKVAKNLKLSSYVVSKFASHNGIVKEKGFIIIRKDNSLTVEQCEWIVKNYSTMRNKDIMEKLDIPYKVLRSFSSRRGLKKENKSLSINSPFTKDEQNYIISNYETEDSFIISKKIGKDISKITAFANRNGLTKSKDMRFYHNYNKKDNLTYEQKSFIRENYSKMKTSQIIKELNVDYEKIKNYASICKLKKDFYSSESYNNYWDISLAKNKESSYNIKNFLGSKVEPKVEKEKLYKSKYGKYFVNQNYFEKIDNEWKAYWLGFLYADGCVTIGKVNNKNLFVTKISLCKKDIKHLEKFKNSIQSDAPIKNRIVKLNNKNYDDCEINICNQNICESLNKNGCFPNKSLILKFPEDFVVSEDLVRHFIRGYFDGDGCIHINLEKKNIIFSMLGTYEFLSQVETVLRKNLNLNEKNIRKDSRQSKAFVLSYGSVTEIERIYRFLYGDSNIFLERKIEKFNTLLCLG